MIDQRTISDLNLKEIGRRYIFRFLVAACISLIPLLVVVGVKPIIGIIAFIVGGLGSLGLFNLVANRIFHLSTRFFPSYIDNTPKDYRYKEIEIWARISEEGFAWETFRKAKIVSLTKNLKDIELGVSSEDIVMGAEPTVEPKDFEVKKPPARGYSLSTKATNYIIHTNTPIKKHKTAEFTFYYTFRKFRAPHTEELLWASSNREVDTLKFRLILSDDIPAKVLKRVLDTTGIRELSSTEIEAENSTREYIWTITRPRKDRVYSLTWVTEKEINEK